MAYTTPLIRPMTSSLIFYILNLEVLVYIFFFIFTPEMGVLKTSSAFRQEVRGAYYNSCGYNPYGAFL